MRYKYVYNKLFLLCIFPFFLIVNGCSKQAVLPCPKALILSEASSITTFLTPEGTDIADIETETIIDRIARSCVYKDSNVSVTTTIKFESTKGQNYRKNNKNLKFFVAVIDKEERVVGREVFDLEIEFAKNSRKSQFIDNLEQIIPIRSGYRGIDYTILIGFQLEPLELNYNKQQRKSGKIKRLR